MTVLFVLLILTSVLNGIITEEEGECRNLTQGGNSWEKICSDIQTYCILDNKEPTCKCDDDMEFSKDEGKCIEICSKEKSKGVTWKEYCTNENFGQCVVDQKKPTCSCSDDKYFEIELEKCKENTICEDGEKGFSECEEKNAVCNIIPNKEHGYECKCRKGFEMTIEERCIETDYCAPKSEGDSTCLEKNGRCEIDRNNEKGFVCICNGEKICEDEEKTESNGNFFVNRTTTFINEYSTISQVEISDSFSMETNSTETTMPLTINNSSEKSDFTLASSTDLSEDLLSKTSSVTTEISTNPSSFSSLTVNEDNFSLKEIRNSTESSFDGFNNVDPTEPSSEKSPIVFIVGIVLGAIFVVVMIFVVLLILRWKKCQKNENCNLKIVDDYERKLGSLAPTFFQNENIEILKVPEKPIIPLSV